MMSLQALCGGGGGGGAGGSYGINYSLKAAQMLYLEVSPPYLRHLSLQDNEVLTTENMSTKYNNY